MTLIEVVGLGLVQGITEFLPVSSSGHLLAVRLLFGISDAGGTTLDAFLHLGTLGAVLVYYWRTWWRMVSERWHFLVMLAAATVPAALAGFLLEDAVGEWFRNERALAGSLLFTALVLWWFDRKSTASELTEIEEVMDVKWKDAMTVGLAQVLALLPGVSRSGMTMAAGLGRGMTRLQAVKFSFLLSAPIIAGASLNSLMSLEAAVAGPLALGAGLAAAFMSGLAAIYLLMKYVEKVSFRPFALYLVVLACAILLFA